MSDPLYPPPGSVLGISANAGELILYQLAEIKTDLRDGFARVEGRFDRVEQRLTALEAYRERQEGRERAEMASTALIDSRWLPLLSIAATATVAIVLFILSGGH